MTITQSLRDENAKSSSIADAIDNLAAVIGGGGVSRRSVRDTDKSGQVVEKIQGGISIKSPEKSTATQETGSIRYAAPYLWFASSTGRADNFAEFFFKCEDDEQITVEFTRGDVETHYSYMQVVDMWTGEELGQYNLNSFDSPKFIVEAGHGLICRAVNTEVGGCFCTMIVSYLPYVDVEPNNLEINQSPVPFSMFGLVPKVLPAPVISVSGGPAIYNTTLSYSFPDGLGVSLPYVDKVAVVIKNIGVPIPLLPVSYGETSIVKYNLGGGVGVGADDSQMIKLAGRMWPSLVGYFIVGEGEGLTSGKAVKVNVTVSHGFYPDPIIYGFGYLLALGREDA